jgi:nucleoside-diphosphate-sugar epimerase
MEKVKIMAKITVLGAAGYLGSVLVGKLLCLGHKVNCFDNLMYGQQSLLQYVSYPNFSFMWGDLEDFSDELNKLIEESDVIVPLACIVGAPATNRETSKSYAVNELSMMEIVDICNAVNPKIKIIYPTTNSGYGTKSGEIFCTEETPLEPISHYGKQKVSAEQYILRNYENGITLRLATVFGVSPRMRLDLLVNFFVWSAFKDRIITLAEPQQKRNYVHIQDVADCFIHCLNNFELMKSNAYNVGMNVNHSKGELVEIISSMIDCEVLETKSYVDPDKRNYIVSNSKINNAGFVANRTIEGEIPNLIEAYKILSNLNYGRGVNRNY